MTLSHRQARQQSTRSGSSASCWRWQTLTEPLEQHHKDTEKIQQRRSSQENHLEMFEKKKHKKQFKKRLKRKETEAKTRWHKITAKPILSLITLSVNPTGKAHFLRLDGKERTHTKHSSGTTRSQGGQCTTPASDEKGCVSISHGRLAQKSLSRDTTSHLSDKGNS